MPRLSVGSENSAPVEIHYEDHGRRDPIVLIHGYPLNGNSWERRLPRSGCRGRAYESTPGDERYVPVLVGT